MPSAPRLALPTIALGPIIKPDTLAECHQVIDSLASQLAALAEQVAVLQERVALNSRNSSKPPSSDGPGGSGMNRAQRRASARKRGAQKGHPGAWRELLPPDRVNGVHDCPPPEVCPCGGPVVQRGKPYRHQVFDIPPVQADVQEYRLYSGRCSACRATLRGALPPDVPQGQIGPRAPARAAGDVAGQGFGHFQGGTHGKAGCGDFRSWIDEHATTWCWVRYSPIFDVTPGEISCLGISLSNSIFFD